MLFVSHQRRHGLRFKLTVYSILLSFLASLVTLPVYAQNVLFPQSSLPAVTLPLNVFHPVMMKGLKINPDDPMRFDFVIETGDTHAKADVLRDESAKLVKYFLASLTVPEKEMWVNLSPEEPERIIPASFGRTEMGRDLLAQDLELKRLTASLLNDYMKSETNDTKLGIGNWKLEEDSKLENGKWKLEKNEQKPIPNSQFPISKLIGRIWIVPEKATVFETADGAFVTEAKLKVKYEGEFEEEKLEIRNWKLDEGGNFPIPNSQFPISNFD